ncbi:hypothetical protein [Leptothrix discophora]|uniref:Uncharacterized protein n=1 Tax=Leptothrix discophora TaxID=89 RepID=A0ABT9G193_LEPDI|nr:hypothetical protein [Leptothrix discophora]MDP4300218.1 hypothetical protein [Leptothrix discophora]
MNRILQWLWFFLNNRDYRRYCWARRTKRDAVCLELQQQYPGLTELFDDWGDIHAVDLFGDAAAQREWWEPRSHLFWDLPHIKWIEEPSEYKPRAGYMLVELPLMKTKAEALRMFEKFLDLNETGRKRAHESTKPQFRLIMQKRPGSKYHYHPEGWKLSTATRKALAKAAYVGRLRYRKTPAGKPLSLTDKVLAIKEDPKNPFGWSLTEQDKRDIAKGVYKKGLFGGSEVTLVKRAQKDFDAYVRNTIYGRFPDNS